jgi:catalase
VGAEGPVLLQDHYLIEQMANFNRERIPERQPYAKGGGAFGHIKGLMRDDAGAFAQAVAHFERGPRLLALASAMEDAGSAYCAGTRVTR